LSRHPTPPLAGALLAPLTSLSTSAAAAAALVAIAPSTTIMVSKQPFIQLFSLLFSYTPQSFKLVTFSLLPMLIVCMS